MDVKLIRIKPGKRPFIMEFPEKLANDPDFLKTGGWQRMAEEPKTVAELKEKVNANHADEQKQTVETPKAEKKVIKRRTKRTVKPKKQEANGN